MAGSKTNAAPVHDFSHLNTSAALAGLQSWQAKQNAERSDDLAGEALAPAGEARGKAPNGTEAK